MCEATRSKEVFTKHVESVLNKTAKIRALVSDLQKNYPDDGTAKKLLILTNEMNMENIMFSQYLFCLSCLAVPSLPPVASQGNPAAQCRLGFLG